MMANSQQSSFANEEYTVGWICALSTELAAAKGLMDEIHGSPQTMPAEADNNTYVLGSIGKFKVVVACLPLHQIGASSATASAKEMLFTFPKIRIGLLVGIGAGIPDPETGRDIRLGDVVIGSDSSNGGVVVYDFGKKLADGSFQSLPILNRTPRSLSSALANIKAEHDMQESKIASYLEKMLERYPRMRKTGYSYPGKSHDRLFQPSYAHPEGKKTCSECEASQEIYRTERLDDEPVIHYGTIASGNMVVRNTAMRLQIQEKHSAICLEMEAAGLMNNFPCVVIRGISDYADSHKNDRWQPYAAAAAAAYAKEFLEYVQPKAVDGERALRDILCQVQNEVKSIANFNTMQQIQHILDWITPMDFFKKQNDLLNERQEGTGSWFLQSDEFKNWLNRSNHTLFCPGIPGAGKTLMCSIVVENLKSEIQRSDVQVGCIYCNYQPSHRQTNVDLQLSLLKQFAVKDSQVLPNIEELYSRHSRNMTRPTLEEIKIQLVKTARSFRMVYVVVDALDEFLAESPGELQDFLTGILSLQKEAPVNLLVTSRFNSAILSRFEGCNRKEIRADEDDILRYVDEELPKLPLFSEISKYPQVEDAIRRGVVKSADGMFLLAMLNMIYLGGYTSIGDLEDAISNLPCGEERLDVAYKKGIEIIKGQRLPSYKLAVKTLSWLAYAKRALYATELQHALGTRYGMKDFDPRYLPPLDIIDSLCAGLVTFDRKSGIIRLVHYTTKEFLMRDSICDYAETEITKISITYLSFGAFSSGRSTDPSEYTRRQELYPLHHYCAKNWAAHANAALDSSEDLFTSLLSFLDKESNVNAAGQAMMAHSILGEEQPLASNWLNFIPRRLNKLHLAAHGGLTRVIAEYIRQKMELDIQDSEGRTPLAYAARRGHLETCRILLESNLVDPDWKELDGTTPLLLAASSGHEEVVRMFIQQGVNVDSADQCSNTALSAAASSGNIEAMRVLLDNGAQINYQSASDMIEDGTPLMNAWCSDNPDAVLFLLERGANPDLPNEGGDTLLSAASRNGDEKLVKLLLARGVDVHPRGNSGYTPLAYAAEGGFIGITKLLLHAGADPNMQNHRDKESVLVGACRFGYNNNSHEEVVRLLLEYGADPDKQSASLDTALSISAGKGSISVVTLLLENGADPNITNKIGETSLSSASRIGHEAIVRTLLQGSADPKIRNEAFETSLFSAVREGHASVCGLLLDAGFAVNCQDIVGNTPLFYAASGGSESTVRLLMERGADIHHRNQLQETALFFAARNGRSAVAKVLLEAGATPDPRNLITETPLIQAAIGLCGNRPFSPNRDNQEYSSVIILLLENGANPDPVYHQDYQSDVHYEAWKVLLSSSVYRLREQNPVQNAAREPSEAARQIWTSFLEKYNLEQVLIFLDRLIYEPSDRFRFWWRKGKATPFGWALRGGHYPLVAKLLRSGMSRDFQTSGGKMILEEAVNSRSSQTTELLLNEFGDTSMASSHLPIMLQQAAALGDIPMMKMLFSKQDFSSDDASLALAKAVPGGYIHAVEFLLDKGAKPHLVRESSNSRTTLHFAVFLGDQGMVNLLLDQEIDIDIKDKHGRTPLFYVVQRRQSSIAQLLLHRGADPNTTECGCQEPIPYDDKAFGLYTIPELKIRNRQKEMGGQTPLFFAVGNGQDDLVRALLDKGAEPNHRDKFGETAICWAAGQGFEAIVKMLLDAGSNVNRPDDPSKSPLIWALGQQAGLLSNMIERGRGPGVWYYQAVGDMEAVVRLLLRYGADPNHSNEKGQTPLHMLVESRYDPKPLVDLLLEAGSDSNKKNQFGRTPLMGAIVCGLNQMVAALLQFPNVERDASDNFGRTALIEATRRGGNGILKLLSPDCDEDRPLAVIAELRGREADRRCDICRISLRGENAYSCLICNDGDFDICEDCREWGATCLVDTHPIRRRSI